MFFKTFTRVILNVNILHEIIAMLEYSNIHELRLRKYISQYKYYVQFCDYVPFQNNKNIDLANSHYAKIVLSRMHSYAEKY